MSYHLVAHSLFISLFYRFAYGDRPGNGTSFDIGIADLLEMEQCRGIVVASTIFGTLRFRFPYLVISC